MSNGGQKRTRLERVAAIELPPSRLEQALDQLRRREVLERLGLCALAAIIMWLATEAWSPPFAFRTGYVPPRDIVATVAFRRPDKEKTDRAQQQAREQAMLVYSHDPRDLQNALSSLKEEVKALLAAENFTELEAKIWTRFLATMMEGAAPTHEQLKEQFDKFRLALKGDGALDRLAFSVNEALQDQLTLGLLDRLPDDGKGNQDEIRVHPYNESDRTETAKVSRVRVGDGATVKKRLLEEVEEQFTDKTAAQLIADRVFDWLRPQLKKSTLALDDEATEAERDKTAKAVPTVFTTYVEGHKLAAARHPLTADELRLLRVEHDAILAQTPTMQLVNRSLAFFGMLTGLFVICGLFIQRRAPRLVHSMPRLAAVLLLTVASVGLAYILADDAWRAAMIPLLLLSMILAIAYRVDIAMLCGASAALVVVVARGLSLGDFAIHAGVIAAATLSIGRIRSRSKLIKVGSFTAAVAFALTLCARSIEQQFGETMISDAGKNALWAFTAGFLITGLLPAVERAFGVLTEISLLELGDVAHPLLQELVRRAPGTYNHSINVASLGEAAAESIGARGLLVRVGAYFHDIGKMLKPGYFVENQLDEPSRHDTLMPAMSTLIIIAHIKDGADLARQHHLPQPIIDFIEQHHGTTLVQYFYQRASKLSENNPDAAEVEEDSFRYPGPKPQTKEAAVLMLADAAESASRTLVEPTPSRLENLVEDIARHRLLDGQFDECQLTLRELHLIQESLVKSLTAVYHGRVKYSEQVAV